MEKNIDLRLIESLSCSDEPKVLLVVLETSSSTPVKSGAMMVVDRDFQTTGTMAADAASTSF